MKKLKSFAIARPWLFSLLVALVIPLLVTLPWILVKGQDAEAIQAAQTPAKFTLSLLMLFILWRFGWLEAARFKSLGRLPIWAVMLVLLLVEVIVNSYVITQNLSFDLSNAELVRGHLLRQLVTGLYEESTYRGVIFLAFCFAWSERPHGLLKSVLASSLIFGAMHAMGILADGSDVTLVLWQVAYTSAWGVLACALLIYGQSIYITIVLHALGNALVFINMIGKESAIAPDTNFKLFLVTLPFLALGLWLLTRRSSPPRRAVSAQA